MSGKSLLPISIYIHIPFCRHKCPYCHFYVIADKECFKDQLLTALEHEWRRIYPQIANQKIISIYFGGGTPTLFGPERIQKVLSWFTYDSECEISIETNPEVEADYSKYAEAGINRVSLGVQSLATDELAVLDRRHSPQQAIEAILAIKRAGIDNITIDLMYDLPGQTIQSWGKTLDCIKTLPITHLSLYNLTIEPDAAFFRREKQLRAQMPDDETSTQMYALAQESLKNDGFRQYEISAFCKDDLYSRHNIGYWTGRHFYGLGPSAFSFDGVRRYRNVANLARYSMLLEQGQSPIDFEDAVDAKARKKELLALQLRLLAGCETHDLEPETEKALEYLERMELVTRTGNHVALTRQGILFYDTVASELI